MFLPGLVSIPVSASRFHHETANAVNNLRVTPNGEVTFNRVALVSSVTAMRWTLAKTNMKQKTFPILSAAAKDKHAKSINRILALASALALIV